jgi:hypothetical protein
MSFPFAGRLFRHLPSWGLGIRGGGLCWCGGTGSAPSGTRDAGPPRLLFGQRGGRGCWPWCGGHGVGVPNHIRRMAAPRSFGAPHPYGAQLRWFFLQRIHCWPGCWRRCGFWEKSLAGGASRGRHVLSGASSRYLAPSLPPIYTQEKSLIPWIGRQRRPVRRHLPEGVIRGS